MAISLNVQPIVGIWNCNESVDNFHQRQNYVVVRWMVELRCEVGNCWDEHEALQAQFQAKHESVFECARINQHTDVLLAVTSQSQVHEIWVLLCKHYLTALVLVDGSIVLHANMVGAGGMRMNETWCLRKMSERFWWKCFAVVRYRLTFKERC